MKMFLKYFLLYHFLCNEVLAEDKIFGTSVAFFENFITELGLDFVMIIKNAETGNSHCKTN